MRNGKRRTSCQCQCRGYRERIRERLTGAFFWILRKRWQRPIRPTTLWSAGRDGECCCCCRCSCHLHFFICHVCALAGGGIITVDAPFHRILFLTYRADHDDLLLARFSPSNASRRGGRHSQLSTQWAQNGHRRGVDDPRRVVDKVVSASPATRMSARELTDDTVLYRLEADGALGLQRCPSALLLVNGRAMMRRRCGR